MHKIDGPGAAPGNLFTEGDVGSGVPATTVTDDWLNAIQTELVNVAVSTGAALNKPDNTQVLTAIKALIALSMPTGTVVPMVRLSAPTGWLPTDGQTVSRTTYAGLFALIGTSFDTGGELGTEFRLPDLRGEFIRGMDAGRGVDPDRGLGSNQADMIELHGHPFTSAVGNGNTDSDGAIALDREGVQRSHPAFTGAPTSAIGQVIGGTGGTETRPRNVALRYMIKT